MSTTLEAVRKGIAFIETNLQHNIGVSDVAAAVSYSQFYFSREFSRHTHISIYDYILRRRISEAYKCLFTSDIKIVDLAFRYGFQSHEVFTRAFHKMFGENPSDAAVFKPLAIFEAIDAHYLEFLSGLHMARPEEPECELFFELDAGEEPKEPGSSLMMLSKSNYYHGIAVFKGRITPEDSSVLAFSLHNMMVRLRLFHTDVMLSFRFFFENFHDAGEMGANYLLARKSNSCIDILVPSKPDTVIGE